jgi:hypothetical protein
MEDLDEPVQTVSRPKTYHTNEESLSYGTFVQPSAPSFNIPHYSHKPRFWPYCLNTFLLLLLIVEIYATCNPSSKAYRTHFALLTLWSWLLHFLQLLLFTLAAYWNLLLLEEHFTDVPRRGLLDISMPELSWINDTIRLSAFEPWREIYMAKLGTTLLVFVFSVALVPWLLVAVHLGIQPPTSAQVCLAGGYRSIATMEMVSMATASPNRDEYGSANSITIGGRLVLNGLGKDAGEMLVFYTSMTHKHDDDHDDDRFGRHGDEFVAEYSDTEGTTLGIKSAKVRILPSYSLAPR